MSEHSEISVQVDDAFLKRLDLWSAHQHDKPPRAEALRRLAQEALTLSEEIETHPLG